MRNRNISEPSIVAYFVEEDSTINTIMQYPDNFFYNHYGYDLKRNVSQNNDGGYKTLNEAREMMLKHRSTAIEITGISYLDPSKIPQHNIKQHEKRVSKQLGTDTEGYYANEASKQKSKKAKTVRKSNVLPR